MMRVVMEGEEGGGNEKVEGAWKEGVGEKRAACEEA